VAASRWGLTQRGGDHTRGWGDERGTKTRRSREEEKRRSVSRLRLFIYFLVREGDVVQVIFERLR
jgi:hypothetical protein